MEVFPAFDLPMMSTLNWIFGTRGGPGGGDGAGDDSGAGDGGGDGTRQQALSFTPISRKCCEKKDWTRRNPDLVIIHTVPTSADWCTCGSMRHMPFHFTNQSNLKESRNHRRDKN